MFRHLQNSKDLLPCLQQSANFPHAEADESGPNPFNIHFNIIPSANQVLQVLQLTFFCKVKLFLRPSHSPQLRHHNNEAAHTSAALFLLFNVVH
jgi:hypothetical protein